MVQYTTTILKFDEKGEKTGWTYIVVPQDVTQQLKPNNKKAFRVKGRLDDYAFSGVSLLPMGGGDFIMALNATHRKNIKKSTGAMINVQMEIDAAELTPPAEFMECLQDEPAALNHFYSLAKGHQNYFGNWIRSAKTEATFAKRIAMAVTALSKGMGYPEMIKSEKEKKLL